MKDLMLLLEKHGYKRNDKGYYDVLEHNDDNIVFFCHFGVTALDPGPFDRRCCSFNLAGHDDGTDFDHGTGL